MKIIFIRTLILYAVVVIALRIMGKKQVGELQPSELVIAIMISDLGSIPMEDTDIPLIAGIVPILILMMAEVFVSYIVMKNKKVRKFLEGEPSVIVYNGVINKSEMEKAHFNRSDLLEELRLAGAPNILDVKYALLETSGQMSIILKRDKQPLTVEQATKLLKKERKK